jgi:RHH-type rel operon transcriptional repressor/antitoxin RelB
MPVTISLRLDAQTAKDLNGLASATDRTKTYLIQKAIHQFLDEYADYQIALDRLRDKDDEIISGAEMRRRLA